MPVRWWSACFLCPWSTGISSWWWNKRTLTSSVAMETQHHGHQTLKVSSTLCLLSQRLDHVPISLSLLQLFGIYWAGWSNEHLQSQHLESKGTRIQSCPLLHFEFRDILGYMRPFPTPLVSLPPILYLSGKFQEFLIAKISTTPSTMNIP